MKTLAAVSPPKHSDPPPVSGAPSLAPCCPPCLGLFIQLPLEILHLGRQGRLDAEDLVEPGLVFLVLPAQIAVLRWRGEQRQGSGGGESQQDGATRHGEGEADMLAAFGSEDERNLPWSRVLMALLSAWFFSISASRALASASWSSTFREWASTFICKAPSQDCCQDSPGLT